MFVCCLVTWNYGRIHTRWAARLLSICYWCTQASTWRSGSAKSKIDYCEEGMWMTLFRWWCTWWDYAPFAAFAYMYLKLPYPLVLHFFNILNIKNRYIFISCFLFGTLGIWWYFLMSFPYEMFLSKYKRLIWLLLLLNIWLHCFLYFYSLHFSFEVIVF